jgi:hypothetical protein
MRFRVDVLVSGMAITERDDGVNEGWIAIHSQWRYYTLIDRSVADLVIHVLSGIMCTFCSQKRRSKINGHWYVSTVFLPTQTHMGSH